MTEPIIFEASEGIVGKRLDAAVAEMTDLTRSAAAKLIESGAITVSGKTAAKKYELKCGDVVSVELPEPEVCDAVAENIPLDIVYEDSDIIVINKPSGMVVHPAPGNYTGTLVNALLYYCGESLSGIGGVMRPGIVHRIDKDTSGLLVVAKNDISHTVLSAGMKEHAIVREYHALVRGGFSEDAGTIDLPIGRHPTDRKKMAVIRDTEHTARDAVTHYEVIERYGEVSYLRLRLETGRTHQIRVHMSYKGHPLLGDELYGGGTTKFEKAHPKLFDGQALHAKKLSFEHPISKELLTFECELPDNFKKMLDILSNE